MTGFDSLVDELMACHGYDRAEAEALAEAKLAAGEATTPSSKCQGAVTSDAASGCCGEMRDDTPTPGRSPAASFACDPCPCGGHPECPHCEEAR